MIFFIKNTLRYVLLSILKFSNYYTSYIDQCVQYTTPPFWWKKNPNITNPMHRCTWSIYKTNLIRKEYDRITLYSHKIISNWKNINFELFEDLNLFSNCLFYLNKRLEFKSIFHSQKFLIFNLNLGSRL